MAAREEQGCNPWKPAMSEAASAPLPHPGVDASEATSCQVCDGGGGKAEGPAEGSQRGRAAPQGRTGRAARPTTQGDPTPTTPCPWWRPSGCGKKGCVQRTGRSGVLPWMPSRPSRTPLPKSALTSAASTLSWGSWRRQRR